MSDQVLIYPTKTRSDLLGHMSSLKKKLLAALCYRAQVDGVTEAWFRRRTFHVSNLIE